MAVFKNDPFPGTNYGQYLSWQKVTTPQGQVLYIVPGNSAYVFDPVASNATGRKVFRPNPQKQIEDQANADKQQQELLDQQKFNQSPLGQVLPIAAGTGGLLAANQLMKPGVTAVGSLGEKGILMSDGTIKGAGAVANAGANTSGLGAAAAQGAQGTGANLAGGTVLSTNVDGSALVQLADGSTITTPAGSFAPAAQGGAEVVNSASPMFGAGGSWFNSTASIMNPGTLAPLNIAGGALGAYGAFKASQMGNKKQGITSGALSGAAAGAALSPATLGLSIPIGAVLGGLAGAAAHEKTKDRSARRYGEIAEASNNPAYQTMLKQGMDEDISGIDTWDKGDSKADAPIDLLTRSYGVLKTFGPDWANYTPEQQRSVISALVDKDLINSKQGSYLIDDPTQARQVADTILRPQGAAAATGATQGATPVVKSERAFVSEPTQGNDKVAVVTTPTEATPGTPFVAPNGAMMSQETVDAIRANNGQPINGWGMLGPSTNLSYYQPMRGPTMIQQNPITYAPGFVPWGDHAAAAMPVAVPAATIIKRSKTRSPGIALDGSRIVYGAK